MLDASPLIVRGIVSPVVRNSVKKLCQIIILRYCKIGAQMNTHLSDGVVCIFRFVVELSSNGIFSRYKVERLMNSSVNSTVLSAFGEH